jgi:hypothetical protein
VGKRAVGGITYPPDLEPSVPGIWKLAESKRAPSLGGWKNFKELSGSRFVLFEKHVLEPQR